MTYQDKWLGGKLSEKGIRECEKRYEVVRTFCASRFKDNPFTVADIGSNMNYFGIRLTEDFPLCRVMAFEFHEFRMRDNHLRRTKCDRLMFINRKVNARDLELLASFIRFDLVLAMSLLHHVVGNFNEWLSGLKSLGHHVIIELAGDDSKRRRPTGYTLTPEGAACIGVGRSHLGRLHERPILYLKGNQE